MYVVEIKSIEDVDMGFRRYVEITDILSHDDLL
jgi:hypothetical protein